MTSKIVEVDKLEYSSSVGGSGNKVIRRLKIKFWRPTIYKALTE